MGNKKTIIFDFDGVLVSTFEMCRSLTKEFDGVALEPEAYREFFDGNVLANGVARKFISFHDIEVKTRFLAEYGRRLRSEHLLVPGIEEVVSTLAAASPMHIVTSGDTVIIKDFLRHHAIDQHFLSVLGYDVEHSKVKKFMMLGARGEEAQRYLYVTDTLGDLREAAQAGVPAVAVTWGFHDEERLRRGNPTSIAHTPAELLAAIRAMG